LRLIGDGYYYTTSQSICQHFFESFFDFFEIFFVFLVSTKKAPKKQCIICEKRQKPLYFFLF